MTMSMLQILNKHKTGSITDSLESTSLEEVGSTDNEELEYEIYGKLTNLSEIEKLATQTELQEQYEVRKDGGCIRARAVSLNGSADTKYILTTKKFKDNEARKDVSVETTEEMYDHFKNISDSGLIKRRYFIPIGIQRKTDGEEYPLTWQVDVFLNEQGETLGWVKVDLEVAEPLKEMPTLPIELEDRIDLPLLFLQRTEEQKKKVSKIISSVKISKDVQSSTEDETPVPDIREHTVPFIGMRVEFNSDRLVEPGPCIMTIKDLEDDKTIFTRGSHPEYDDFEIEVDWNEANFFTSVDGFRMASFD